MDLKDLILEKRDRIRLVTIARPPLAVSAALRSLAAGAYENADTTLALNRDGISMLSKSADALEGITAFLQKREPAFKGK